MVALTAAALPMPAGGSAASLAGDLAAALYGGEDIQVEPLPLPGSDVAAVLLRHPDQPRHLGRGVLDHPAAFPSGAPTCTWPAPPATGVVVVVSCRSIGAAATAIDRLVREIPAGFRAACARFSRMRGQ